MEFTAKQIAEFVEGRVEGDENATVNTFAKIEEGKPGAISFLSNPKYIHHIYDTNSSVVLINEDVELEKAVSPTLIRVKNAYESVARLLQLYESMKPKKTGIDSLAFVSPSAKIGKDVYIGPFTYVGENVEIGDGTRIYPNVTIYDGTRIGKQVTIHAGAVIGADGFGFAPNQEGYEKIPQIGIVIIEDNVISNSKCVGISLGKDRQSGQNRWTIERTLSGFNRELEAIFKAYSMGWNKDNIGSHIIRNNHIYDCGQAGVVGHLGGVFSTIENNYIHDINYNVQFGGAEVGCIKLHAAIDVLIKDNVLVNGVRGIWLDWQAIGTRVTGNTISGNSLCDIMVEVSHGPCLVDNNVLLSQTAFLNLAQGSAFVHNIICGQISFRPVGNRYTPYHAPHSTAVVGIMSFPGGDDRYYNNVFYGARRGLSVYDEHPPFYPGIYRDMNTLTINEKMPEEFAEKLRAGSVPAGSNQGNNFWLPMHVGGNVYYNDTPGYKYEEGAATGGEMAMPELDYREDGIYVKFTLDAAWNRAQTKSVDTKLLDKAYYTDSYFENRDETPLRIDHDYKGNARNFSTPKPGPFENARVGSNEIQVWKY